MAKSDPSKVLGKKSEVIAATELPGVPVGTKGRVVIINGLSWIRYWVRFENGITMGSINRSALATPDEWARKLAGGGDDAGAGAGASTADAGGDEADDGAGVVVNGVTIPTRLIERSKAARARLAA